MIITNDDEKLFEAVRAHDEMEDTIRYLAEGRSLADWDDDALKSHWLGAWEDFFLYGSRFAGKAYHDTSAELRVRGLAPTEERITASMRRQAIAVFRDTWNRPHVHQRLSADINRFLKDWEKPRNWRGMTSSRIARRPERSRGTFSCDQPPIRREKVSCISVWS
jgi:hypothetical protein